MPAPRLVPRDNASPIFVNRDGPLERVDAAIRDIPADGLRLLVFHGVGGQGKSALCRKILEQVTSPEDARYEHLKTAEVDLRGRDKTDPISLLIWIRNAFADRGVSFAAFDLALAVTWDAIRPEQSLPKLSNAWLAKSSELIAEGAPETIKSVREVVEQSVETIPLLGPVATRASQWVMAKGKEAWIKRSRPQLAHLYERPGVPKKPYELEALLPWMLAQDLNHHTTSNADHRLLLLVDEYERVLDQGGAGRRWEENPFDAAMRGVLAESNALLAIFFSREPLPWQSDPNWRDDLANNQYGLSGLSNRDATLWLARSGITDVVIQSAMIDGAREEKRPSSLVYPLLLELQIIHWQQLSDHGAKITADAFDVDAQEYAERSQVLVTRVLRDYGENLQFAIERLAVTTRFDRETFEHVINSAGIALSVDAFDRIANLSLFSPADNDSVSMHRAVADIVVASLTPEKRQESIESLLAHFEARLIAPSPKAFSSNHLFALFEAARLRARLGMAGYVAWLTDRAEPLAFTAQFVVGEQLWREALAQVLEKLGSAHPDTGTSYGNVASNLNGQGRYDEAEPLYRKNLAIRQRLSGEDHPDTAVSYNNLASNLNAQGRYDEAEPMLWEALKILQRVYGEAHANTASSYNNVASNLRAQGRYGEAEPLYRKALETWLRGFGEDDPRTATSYNNLATNLLSQGQYAKAEPLFRKGLEIRQRVLGEDHPDTAASYSNLASNFRAQGHYDQAEPLHWKALEIWRRLLGENHPSTASSYDSLASNLLAQGRYAEAEPLYRKGLEIRRRVLGEDHPSLAGSYSNVASNLNAQGRYKRSRTAVSESFGDISARIGRGSSEYGT